MTTTPKGRYYLDNIWYPIFFLNWIRVGELEAILKEKKVWSETANSLVPIQKGSMLEESQETLMDWCLYATYAYQRKEMKLGLLPILRKANK